MVKDNGSFKGLASRKTSRESSVFSAHSNSLPPSQKKGDKAKSKTAKALTDSKQVDASKKGKVTQADFPEEVLPLANAAKIKMRMHTVFGNLFNFKVENSMSSDRTDPLWNVVKEASMDDSNFKPIIKDVAKNTTLKKLLITYVCVSSGFKPLLI